MKVTADSGKPHPFIQYCVKGMSESLAMLPQYRVARWPVFHRPGRYFTANLAEASKKPVF